MPVYTPMQAGGPPENAVWQVKRLEAFPRVHPCDRGLSSRPGVDPGPAVAARKASPVRQILQGHGRRHGHHAVQTEARIASRVIAAAAAPQHHPPAPLQAVADPRLAEKGLVAVVCCLDHWVAMGCRQDLDRSAAAHWR